MNLRIVCVVAALLFLAGPAFPADVNCDGRVTVADIVAALFSSGEAPPCVQGGLPATGQQTCWNISGNVISCADTGHDGDTQAGAALSYTDNGDGTITDNATGLQWEKLDDNNAGGIHDWDNRYSWPNAFAVKIATLNTPPCFADHCDWRLPNLKELQSILNYEPAGLGPSVSPAFDDNCSPGCTVLTCSCTRASDHWTSTSYAYIPVDAWTVDFSHGQTDLSSKSFPSLVRAVRGGL